MADEMDLLRDFRHDLADVDTETIDRLIATIQAQAARTADPIGTSADASGDLAVVPLDRAPHRRRTAAAALAAAVVVLLGLAAWGVTARDEDVATHSGAPLAPLIADPAPEGFTLVSGRPADGEGRGRRTVYLPADGDGRYDGPMITVIATPWPELGPAASREPIETSLLEDGDLMLLFGGTATHSHHLLARGLSPDEARVAHAAVVVGEDGSPHVAPDALPPGWRSAEVDDRGRDADPASSGSLMYRGPTDDELSINLLLVTWTSGTEEALDQLWLHYPRVERCGGDGACARVDGNPTAVATVSTSDGDSALLSWVVGRRLVVLTGHGPTLDDLYAVAESLRPSTWDEIEELAGQPMAAPDDAISTGPIEEVDPG